MGDAKRRGTPEERVQQAIKLAQERAAEPKPEVSPQTKKAAQKVLTLMAIANSFRRY
jgi:hypothetical protein